MTVDLSSVVLIVLIMSIFYEALNLYRACYNMPPLKYTYPFIHDIISIPYWLLLIFLLFAEQIIPSLIIFFLYEIGVVFESASESTTFKIIDATFSMLCLIYVYFSLFPFI